jgi:hypothetical protein
MSSDKQTKTEVKDVKDAKKEEPKAEELVSSTLLVTMAVVGGGSNAQGEVGSPTRQN